MVNSTKTKIITEDVIDNVTLASLATRPVNSSNFQVQKNINYRLFQSNRKYTVEAGTLKYFFYFNNVCGRMQASKKFN